MRIVSGKFGGLLIEATKGHKTHPMSEKIRGGLFASLGDISNLSVLDVFAGTGAIGLEAISRGASRVVFVEKDKHASAIISNNINNLSVADVSSLYNMSALSWLKRNKHEKFDLIICDPPYDELHYETIESCENLLSTTGILVLSWPPKRDLPRFKEIKIIKTKEYGDAQILYYRQ